MTREDAIQMIKAHKFPNPTEAWQMLNNEAIDLAIEALTVAVRRRDTVTLNSPISIQAEMVAVVRCKDCRYYWGNLSEDDTDEMYGECRWDNDEMPNADDFCSYGERAEQTEYKLPGHDEVMDALDNMKLEFTINGKERIKRIKEGDTNDD